MRLEGGIDPCHEPLAGRFFITRGAVDLACVEQPAHPLGLQGRSKLRRRDKIVFHRIAGQNNFGLFQARNGLHKLQLHFLGKTGGNAVRINPVRVEAFGFQKNVMRIFIRKLYYLIFYGRTIARANSIYHAAV